MSTLKKESFFLKANVLFLYSCFFNSSFVLFSKLLGGSFSPYELAFYRVLIIFLVSASAIVSVKGVLPSLKKLHPLFFAKSILALLSMVTWFITINNLPIAETIAVSFSTPIFTSALAILIYKEKFHFNHFIAFVCGVIGMYIIIMPEVGNFNQYALVGLASCFLLSLSFVIIKYLTRKYDAIEVNYYSNILMLPMALALSFQDLNVSASAMDFVLVAVFGVCIFLADFFHNLSYKKADITHLSPLMFTTIIFGAIGGYLVFGESIRMNVAIGSAIVIFGIIYLNFRSKKKIK